MWLAPVAFVLVLAVFVLIRSASHPSGTGLPAGCVPRGVQVHKQRSAPDWGQRTHGWRASAV